MHRLRKCQQLSALSYAKTVAGRIMFEAVVIKADGDEAEKDAGAKHYQ